MGAWDEKFYGNDSIQDTVHYLIQYILKNIDNDSFSLWINEIEKNKIIQNSKSVSLIKLNKNYEFFDLIEENNIFPEDLIENFSKNEELTKILTNLSLKYLETKYKLKNNLLNKIIDTPYNLKTIDLIQKNNFDFLQDNYFIHKIFKSNNRNTNNKNIDYFCFLYFIDTLLRIDEWVNPITRIIELQKEFKQTLLDNQEFINHMINFKNYNEKLNKEDTSINLINDIIKNNFPEINIIIEKIKLNDYIKSDKKSDIIYKI